MESLSGTLQAAAVRVLHAIRVHGLAGTFGLILRKCTTAFSPRVRLATAKAAEAEREFDRRWGVETTGVVRLSKLPDSFTTALLGHRYQGVNPARFCEVLQSLEIDHSEFTFVDIGSGKGRAVLLASTFGFRRIIGIEYNPQLHEVACANLHRFPAEKKVCQKVVLLCSDATTLSLPNEPIVLFLYNPFGPESMKRLIRAVEEDYMARPRRLIVIYFSPECARLWDAVSFLKRRSRFPAIYESIH